MNDAPHSSLTVSSCEAEFFTQAVCVAQRYGFNSLGMPKKWVHLQVANVAYGCQRPAFSSARSTCHKCCAQFRLVGFAAAVLCQILDGGCRAGFGRPAIFRVRRAVAN